MRVVCLLLLLGCSMLGVSSQYVTDGTTTTAGWIFTGVQSGATNPTLNLTAGNTYNFTVTATSATSPQHPFNFSSAANKGATTLAALDTTLYSVSPSAECTTLNNGYLGNGCVVSLTIANGAAGQSIYYKCTFHGDMTGTINITAAATTTAPTATPTPTPTVPAGNATAAPTTPAGNATATPTVPAGNATTAPTTPAGNATNAPTTPAGNATNAPTPTATPTAAPTQITGATLSGNAFHITGANGTAGYIFTVNNQQYLNPTLNITAGTDWTISIEFANTFHPFGFSPNGTTSAVALSQAFFPDWLNNISVTNFATCNAPNNGVWVVKANATTPSTSPCVLGVHTDSSYAGKQLYYRCGSHAAMVGTINFVAAAATPAPSSTGRGNTASTVTGAGLALVMALLTAFIKA